MSLTTGQSRVKTYLLSTLCLYILFGTIQAQTNDHANWSEEFCRTDQVHTQRMQMDPEYRKHFLRHTKEIDSLLRNPSLLRSSQQPIYTVPIVVHVIHLGEAVGVGSNISDDQVFAAVQGLNDRFSNAIGMGPDIEIEFCLASRAPDGCATNGIVRVDGSDVANYEAEGIEYDNCGADEQDIKDLSRWPSADYYNIWVVHDICGNYAGYAYYPNGGPYDGTVIVDGSMIYNSRTLAHELGHGWNLRHTFNGDNDGDECPQNTNCMTQGDLICDTPPHKRGDCGSSNPCGGGGVWENSRYNYMSYCGTPNNLGRFTSDQKDRMHAAMQAWPRSQLLDSEGCDAPIQGEILSSDEPMCPDEQRVLEGFPDDGSFQVVSGPGDVSGNTLTALGDGTIVLHFISCAGTLEQEIIVYPNPEPDITSDDGPMCVDEERELTAIPGGGEFTVIAGPGFLDGNILIATGSGIIDVMYVADENGCTGETFVTIESFNNPEPYFENDNSGMCIGDSRVLLASPPGGDFELVSGPGSVNGDILTAEGAGVIVVEYIVTENGCTGTDFYEVEAGDVPQPVITTSADPMCFDEARELTADPSGGIFAIESGPGEIEAGHLMVTDFGTVVVVYTYHLGECEATDTLEVIFQEEESPAIAVADSMLCSPAETEITVSPAGGALMVLGGPGVLNGNILIVNAPGLTEVEYRTCAGVALQSVQSVAYPTPEFLSSDSPMCAGESRDLIASLTGGNFSVLSGPGQIKGTTLETTGAGAVTIEYTVSVDGCESSVDQTIEVQSAEDVQVELNEYILTADVSDGLLQWVDCENQYEPVAGENSDVFVVTTTGTYALITTQGMCVDTSECIQVILSDVEDAGAFGEVRVAPNPSDGVFSIFVEKYQEGTQLIVRDLMGHRISTLQSGIHTMQVDLTDTPSGVYVLELLSDRSRFVQKVIVQ